jgi:1-acyl-sn-glycerol-3-phosphate acyltransferase
MSSVVLSNVPRNDIPEPPPRRTPWQRFVVGVLQWSPAVGLYHRTVKALFGLRLRGTEQIPSVRPLLLAANHASHYDGLFMRTIGREVLGEPIVSIASSVVRNFPFAKTALDGHAFHVVLADESGGTSESRASVLDQMIEHLRAGRSVSIHPQGDRYDKLTRFQPGAAYAAIETGTPIVPLTLQGVHALWRELPFPRRWWGRVTVQVHPPVYPQSFAHLPRREGVHAMTAEVRRRIASALDYPDSLQCDGMG